MKPIPFNALAKILDLKHSSQNLISGAAIDSRKVHQGDIFFALTGSRVDGHQFLHEVAKKGAAGAVVEKDYRGESYDLPLLYVPNVLDTLQDLARRILQKRSSRVVAITGSVGKTTTKEFAATLLHDTYKIFASPLSYNSQATVPLSILMADGNEDVLILEMGMSMPGQISKLVSIAPPDIALITTVAVQHATHFEDGISAISKEKASLFSHAKTRLGIVHRDILHFNEVASVGQCIKKSFSLKTHDADFFLERKKEKVCVFTKKEPPFEVELNLPFPACYQNYLAAIALARSLDVPWSSIREYSHYLKLPPMRFERCKKKGITFINDAYNANFESMKEALENLPSPGEGGKKIAVLGEMDALGDFTIEAHTLVAEIALKHVDLLLCIGERCETMLKIWKDNKRDAHLFHSRSELEAALHSTAKEGDVVLLKGARTFALEEILNQY